MNTEEKKTLEQNTLIQQLTSTVEGLKKGPSRATYFFIGAVVLLVGSAAVFRYFYQSSVAAASHRWAQIDEIVFPEQLKSLAEDSAFKETPEGRFVRFKEARLLLTQGLRDFASSPGTARENVEKGTKIYEDLARSAGRVPLLHQEALWGTAKGYETLGEADDLSKARSFYERLVKEYPQSALGKEAAKRLDRLNSEAGQKQARELSKLLKP